MFRRLGVDIARTARCADALLAQNCHQRLSRYLRQAGLGKAVMRVAARLGIVADLYVVGPGVAGVCRFERSHLPASPQLPRTPHRHEQPAVGKLQNAAVGDRLAHGHLDRLVALPRFTAVARTIYIGAVAAYLATRFLHELLVERP